LVEAFFSDHAGDCIRFNLEYQHRSTAAYLSFLDKFRTGIPTQHDLDDINRFNIDPNGDESLSFNVSNLIRTYPDITFLTYDRKGAKDINKEVVNNTYGNHPVDQIINTHEGPMNLYPGILLSITENRY